MTEPQPPDDPKRAVSGVAIALIFTLGASTANPLVIAVTGVIALLLLTR